MYVLAVAGVVIVWVAAPPSDHPWKVYVVPLTVCVAAAPIGRGNRTTLSTVAGAVRGWPSSVRGRPVGAVAGVVAATLGRTVADREGDPVRHVG